MGDLGDPDERMCVCPVWSVVGIGVVGRRNSDKKWNGDGFYLPVICYSIRGGRLCKLFVLWFIDGGSVCGGLEDFQDFQSLKLLP